MRVLMMFGFAAMWIAVACAAPLTDTMVPLPAGEVTVRRVWEGILETDAQVVAALASTAPFDGPAALPADHASQIPLDMALDAMAEPLGLIWYHDPVGVVLMYPRPADHRPFIRDTIPRDAVASMSTVLDLFNALPTDEDREHLLHGDWLQAQSADDPFGRTARRMIRQFWRHIEPDLLEAERPLVALCVFPIVRGLGTDGAAQAEGAVLMPPTCLPTRDLEVSEGDSPLSPTRYIRGAAECPPALSPPLAGREWALPVWLDQRPALALAAGQPSGASASPVSSAAVELRAALGPGVTCSALLDNLPVLATPNRIGADVLAACLMVAADLEVRAIGAEQYIAPAQASAVLAGSSGMGICEEALTRVLRETLGRAAVRGGWSSALADTAWDLTRSTSASDLLADQSSLIATACAIDESLPVARWMGTEAAQEGRVVVEFLIELKVASAPIRDWNLHGPKGWLRLPHDYDAITVLRVLPSPSDVESRVLREIAE